MYAGPCDSTKLVPFVSSVKPFNGPLEKPEATAHPPSAIIKLLADVGETDGVAGEELDPVAWLCASGAAFLRPVHSVAFPVIRPEPVTVTRTAVSPPARLCTYQISLKIPVFVVVSARVSAAAPPPTIATDTVGPFVSMHVNITIQLFPAVNALVGVSVRIVATAPEAFSCTGVLKAPRATFVTRARRNCRRKMGMRVTSYCLT